MHFVYIFYTFNPDFEHFIPFLRPLSTAAVHPHHGHQQLDARGKTRIDIHNTYENMQKSAFLFENALLFHKK